MTLLRTPVFTKAAENPVSVKIPRSAGASLKALARTAALPVSVKVPVLAISVFAGVVFTKVTLLPVKVKLPVDPSIKRVIIRLAPELEEKKVPVLAIK